MTWILLIWLAQAAFDLFTWALLIMLVATHGYHGRHDRLTGDRSPPADLPPQTTPLTTPQASDLRG